MSRTFIGQSFQVDHIYQENPFQYYKAKLKAIDMRISVFSHLKNYAYLQATIQR